MALALLDETPLVPSWELGPYRRHDYERLPDDVRCELLLGRFYMTPSPAPAHQALALLLWQYVQRAAEIAGGWAFAAPLDVVLAEHSVVQPDVIYISAARGSIVQQRIEGAPDIVIEVLSPGSARRDRAEKLSLYAKAGVREYWIGDPVERQVEFLVNEQGRFVVVLPEAGVYRSPTLPGLDLDLAELWRIFDQRLPPAR